MSLRNLSQREFFTSQRERRLWGWTWALIATIYATLGLSSKLVGLVSDEVLLVLFASSLLLVGATILTQGLKTRPRGVEVGVGIGIAVVYVLLFVRLSLPERSHLMEYSVVSVFMYEALTERASHHRRVPLPALLTLFVTSIVGAVDEWIQLYLPDRVFDWDDMLFNFLASLLAVISMVLLNWIRRFADRKIAADQ